MRLKKSSLSSFKEFAAASRSAVTYSTKTIEQVDMQVDLARYTQKSIHKLMCNQSVSGMISCALCKVI